MAKRETIFLVDHVYVAFQTAVLRALPRDIDPNVALKWIKDDAGLARALREALTWKDNVYPVSVNYVLAVEEAVELGRYDRVGPDINSKNFSTELTGLVDVLVELIRFNRLISTKEVVNRIEELGYRSVNLQELIAFGTQYPGIQRDFPVVAPDCIWRGKTGDFVPCISGDEFKRELDLLFRSTEWGEDCRFAVVRKNVVIDDCCEADS